MRRQILMSMVLGLGCLGVAHAQELPQQNPGGVPQPPGLDGVPTTPEAMPQPIGGAGGSAGSGMVVSSPVAGVSGVAVETSLAFSPAGTELLDPQSDSTAGPQFHSTRASAVPSIGGAASSSSASGQSYSAGSGLGTNASSTWRVSGFGARLSSSSAGIAGLKSYDNHADQPYTGFPRISSADRGPGAVAPRGLQLLEGASRRGGLDPSQPPAASPFAGRPLPRPAIDLGDASALGEPSPESSIQTPAEGYRPYLGPRRELGQRGTSPASRGHDPRGRMSSNSRLARWERLHPSTQDLRRRKDLRSRGRTAPYR